MERQYSVKFFSSFVENLQQLCQTYLSYNQFVEVSGYVSVEIDNMKKERYVLSELLQSSGHVLSESYCTKACMTNIPTVRPSRPFPHGDTRSEHVKENLNREDLSRPILKSSSYQDVSFQPKPSQFSHTEVSSRPYVCLPGSSKKRIYEGSGLDMNVGNRSHDIRKSQDQLLEVTKTETESSEEVIDLDLMEDEGDDSQTDFPPHTFVESHPDSIRLPDSCQQKKVNPGSLNVMKSAVKRFKNFHFDKTGRDIDLLSTEPDVLNQMFLDYFREARKQDGGQIMAGSFRTVQMYIDRYLKEKGYPYSINKDVRFKTSRDYIKLKVEEEEKTKTHQKPIPVDENDMETLFQSHVMGSHSCETLLNTMWFMASKFFGIRRPMEHINLKWGDIRLQEGPDGREYVERIVNGAFSLKEYSKPDNPSRCFVNYFKQYQSLRPKLSMEESSPFYLKLIKGQGQESVFSDENMSYSYSSGIWRKMITAAGLAHRKKIL